MSSAAIETGVDELIRFLEKSGKVSIKDAAVGIKVPEATLQLWVDFLVEERIIGIEYKFTKPYIFLNIAEQKKPTEKEDKKDLLSITFYKDEFIKNAKKKKLPENTVSQLWQKHASEAIDKQKEFFIREAKKRNLERPEELFEQYKKKLLAA